MILKRRLTLLEGRAKAGSDDQRDPVILGLTGKTEGDVVGLHSGARSNTIERHSGEDFGDFVKRAQAALQTPWGGLPLILCCTYAEDAE